MTGPDPEARATAWLAAWDGQGTHRTGTVGDAAGADWLTREAASVGADVTFEDFTLDRVDPVEAYLAIEGTRFDGVPVFDAPPTSAEGVTGALGPPGGDASLIVTALSPQAVYSGEYQLLRRDPRQRGLVVVCQGTHPGLGLLNAEQFRTPYGAPALHLDTAAHAALTAAAARGAAARLVVNYARTPSLARNVVVTLPGRDRTRPPIVVMTPRSSWWQSTAERGGGIVCWLETLRALLAARPRCDVVLTANSGHELGHLGLDEFIARRPGWDCAAGAIWVHYGANIGAVSGKLSIMSADDALRDAMSEALVSAGQPADTLAPKTQVPSGETRDIHRAGGRYVTLVGSNPWFHLPQDRWPDTVDVPTVARIAAAAAGMVVALTA